MKLKCLETVALGMILLVSAPLAAEAGSRPKPRPDSERNVERDCRPFNGPFGYYGNPWCDGGYKFEEDFPPGTSGSFDVFDLPQVQRLRQRFE